MYCCKYILMHYKQMNHNISNYRIAKVLDISVQAVDSWLSGKTKPCYKNRKKLCNLLGISSSDERYLHILDNENMSESQRKMYDIVLSSDVLEVTKNPENLPYSKSNVAEVLPIVKHQSIQRDEKDTRFNF